MTFLCYPKCSTCQKAKHFLSGKEKTYTERHIKEAPPTQEELRQWQIKSGLPLRKFFNTSGQVYRTLSLKDRLPTMSEEEQLTVLSSDGMLVKRPILIGDDFVLLGFRESEWEARL